MNEVSPDLAAKVISADLRNLIKKVGDGGTLSSAERQMFIDFNAAQGDAEDLHRTRTSALLRKWLNGARLTREERDEIAPILPDRPAPEKAYVGSPEENAARIGLSRRPFFRWQAHGREHNDPLPCHEPSAVPAWYERMRARGVFKNRCPKEVLTACRKGGNDPAPAAGAVGRPAQVNGSGGATNPGGLRAFLADDAVLDLNDDIERMHRALTAHQRRAAKLYEEGDDDAGTQAMSRAVELLDKVTMGKQRILKIESAEGLAYPKDELARDLGAIVRGVVSNFLQAGRAFHLECQSPLPREAFLSLWRDMLRGVLMDLIESKYAPPLTLEAA